MNKTKVQLIPKVGKVGNIVNKIVQFKASDINKNTMQDIYQLTTETKSHELTQVNEVTHKTPGKISHYVQETTTLPPIEIVSHGVNSIEGLHPILCDDLKAYLFPENQPVDQANPTHPLESDQSPDQSVDNLSNKSSEQPINDMIAIRSIKYSKYFEPYVRNVRIDKFSNLLNISKSAEKLKTIFFNGVGQIAHFHDQSTDITNNYDVTKKENIDTIISISRQNFLNLILEVYPNDDAIIKQFLVDFPRQDVFLNGRQIFQIDNLLMELSTYNKMINLDNFIEIKPKPDTKLFGSKSHISTMMLTLAMICQSSFYVSFFHLHDKITKLKSTLDLDAKMENDYRYNVHVTDFKERNQIRVNTTKNSFSCAIEASYKIMDIVEEKTLYKITTETLFDLDSDTCIIVYGSESIN